MDARFGTELKVRRQFAELSLRELAELADISASGLSRLERGEMLPARGTLRRLCKVLDWPYAWAKRTVLDDITARAERRYE